MNTIAIVPATKDGLSAEATTWSARARALTITDKESCLHASQRLRSITGLRSQIQRGVEPHIEAAMETKRKADAARKALVDEKDRIEAPLVDAEGVIKRSLLTFETEQERIRQAEERRLQAAAQAEAERVTLDAAAALEREAVATGDVEMLAEAQDILAQPIEAPVVWIAKLMPKVQGIVYKDHWETHPTIDVKALAAAVGAGLVPATFLSPNMTALNQYARATQGAGVVPGVKFWNNRGIAARG